MTDREKEGFRDVCAVAALTGMLAHSRNGTGYHPRDEDNHLHWHDAIAKEAFELADAMVRAREATNEPRR